jgi:hypothetical protein
VKSLFAVITLTLLTACATGSSDLATAPTTASADKSADAPAKPSLVLERQPKTRKVEGVLLIEDRSAQTPVKYQTLVLRKDQKEVLRAMSDSEGKFLFAGALENGTYTIELVSDEYEASTDLDVSEHETRGVQIFAHEIEE